MWKRFAVSRSEGSTLSSGPLGIVRDTAGVGERLIVIRPIPIAAPLPDVAGHVVKTVAVGRKRTDRRRADKAIFKAISLWEMSLKRVYHPLASRPELVAGPSIRFAFQPAARREVELRFARQPFTGPVAISERAS